MDNNFQVGEIVHWYPHVEARHKLSKRFYLILGYGVQNQFIVKNIETNYICEANPAGFEKISK